MRITIKVGALCALGWIAIKMILFFAGVQDTLVPGIMLNTLFLLIAICVGLYLTKVREDDSNALTDIKNGLSAALPYTIILSAFMYIYYDSIDDGFLKHRKAELMTTITKNVDDDAKWAKFKKDNPDFETMSKEEYLKQQDENQDLFLSSKSVAMLNLLGGLVLGTFYSIFVTVIFRKFIFRRRSPTVR